MRNRHYLIFDLIAMSFIPIVALSLRLDANISFQEYGNSLLFYTGLTILIKIPTYYKFGLYKHLWKYASIEEVSVILLAILTGAFIFNLLYLVLLPFLSTLPLSIPRSVPAIDLMLSFSLHGGVRLLSRIFSTEMKKRDVDDETRTRVLIIGAGNSGTMIAKEMQRNPADGLKPVAFIDDDPRKKGCVINGIPVIGGRDMIPGSSKKLNISQVLIAMPSAPGKSIRAIMQIIEPLKLKTKTLPSVSELVNDVVDMQSLRDVRIDDLLRREPVKTDAAPIKKMLTGQTVLVTGAGGSIGSEICRHIAQCKPALLLLLGHGENSIHAIHRELSSRHPSLSLRCIIADIRDEDRIRQILDHYHPGYIYHAAAHKHVPLMEDNIVDSITNNVLGTLTMLKCAKDCDVKNFTLISTDKAVRPRSIMGVTKRMAEIALQLFSREDGLHYVAVRFGNVLGSRGSVIPIFMEQIENGGPITITHPEMRRYFMTIPEAVQLVLQASALKGNGEINVLDMGEPERILDLALDLLQLSGRIPYKDVDIVFTGLRPGEKLSEELFRHGEVFAKSKHEKIFSVYDPIVLGEKKEKSNGGIHGHAGVATDIHFQNGEEFERIIRTFLLNNAHMDTTAFVEKIKVIVPEFEYTGDNETATVPKLGLQEFSKHTN